MGTATSRRWLIKDRHLIFIEFLSNQVCHKCQNQSMWISEGTSDLASCIFPLGFCGVTCCAVRHGKVPLGFFALTLSGMHKLISWGWGWRGQEGVALPVLGFPFGLDKLQETQQRINQLTEQSQEYLGSNREKSRFPHTRIRAPYALWLWSSPGYLLCSLLWPEGNSPCPAS